MFRIRDFSRLARVSIKTLRHYDRLGLLAPAYVDPVTRYRWYAARQMSRLQRIVAFRQLGYSLEEIGSFIDRDPRSAVVRRSLVSLREEIARRIESDRQRLAQLDVRLRESDGSRAGDRSARLPDAVLQSLPPLRVASRRARVADLDGGAQELFEAVEADVARAGVRAVGPPLLLYHDPSHREHHADIEAAVPIQDGARSAGRSTVRTIPAVADAACVVYRGGYEQWADVVQGLLSWLETRRLAPLGPVREVFLQFEAGDLARELPRQFLAEQRDDLVTEMQIPVREETDRTPRRARSRARRRRVAPPRG
jgi:DNA-binding transcriptional MerR regulator